MAAIIPTIIMGACFMFLKTDGMNEEQIKADDHSHDKSAKIELVEKPHNHGEDSHDTSEAHTH